MEKNPKGEKREHMLTEVSKQIGRGMRAIQKQEKEIIGKF